MSTAHRTRFALLVALAALAFPAAASAQTGFTKPTDADVDLSGLVNAISRADSYGDEYDAEDEVERVLDRRNPHYTWYAFCRQVGSRKFTCRISGWGRNYHHAAGRAEVTFQSTWRYRVRVVSLRYED